MNDGPNPLTWDARVLSYWFSRNPAVFQDYLVSCINNLRGGRAKDLSAPRVGANTFFFSFFLSNLNIFFFLSNWCCYNESEVILNEDPSGVIIQHLIFDENDKHKR